MADIIPLNALTPKVLLHQILERDDVEAILVAIRIDDQWHTHWTANTRGGLAMAAMKIWLDVSRFVDDNRQEDPD